MQQRFVLIAFPTATYAYMWLVPITPDNSLIIKSVIASAVVAYFVWRSQSVKQWDGLLRIPGIARGLITGAGTVLLAGTVHWTWMLLGLVSSSYSFAHVFNLVLTLGNKIVYTMTWPNLNFTFLFIYAGVGIALAFFETAKPVSVTRRYR